jgi:hypothetical protein
MTPHGVNIVGSIKLGPTVCHVNLRTYKLKKRELLALRRRFEESSAIHT